MILAQIKFGLRQQLTKEELEDIAENYLASLMKAGQICGEYLLAWTDGILNAHLSLAGPDAFRAENHSQYGIRDLAKVTESFGGAPFWVILDDNCPNEPLAWKGAPSLYLFTHAFSKCSPVRHGANGGSIPVYTIPISFEVKEGLYSWQATYRELDNLQLGCDALEMTAYRELADPESELARSGRSLCRRIETGTNIPTFYYLLNYWTEPKGEQDRVCPGCGNIWQQKKPTEKSPQFYHFDFRCDNCRLVSHVAVATDGGN